MVRTFLVSLTLVALVFAACGGDSGPPSEPAGEAAATVTPDSPGPDPAGEDAAAESPDEADMEPAATDEDAGPAATATEPALAEQQPKVYFITTSW